ncbi:hypothetical protein M3175_16005 [Robertmurraya korlensis]|uniref:hypothetical protein n=1 Tax=Robertmurraya korlensis TaxID=519977 RepID=UPI00203B55E9|nr:hypothetical protein [Robertmurraya korlensis]MCM3602237.1 hypothetical protein [Robertmurraya korlensis]
MNKAVKWTMIVAPIVVLAIVIVSMFSIPTMTVQAQGFHGMRGGDVHSFHVRGMMVNQSFFLVPFLLGLLAKAGLVIAGWMLWVRGKSNGMKLTGGILLALGILSLVPTILAIPLLILLGYLLYKSTVKKDTNVQELMTGEDLVVPSYTNRDFLDEWENKVRREEK